MRGVVWVGSIGVHPLNGIISPLHVERVIVMSHPFLHSFIKELLGDHMTATHEPVVIDYWEGKNGFSDGENILC